MNKRSFEEWITKLTPTIAGYSYYVDFDKICKNVGEIADKLKILNDLIGSNNIRSEFIELVHKHPEISECIFILIAIRENTIQINRNGKIVSYNINHRSSSPEDLADLMESTGLFWMMQHRLSNIVDYVYGIETGLDSNARKNRGGHLMEDLLEKYIQNTGHEYYKEMYAGDIEKKWNLNLSPILNEGKTKKRFDYVVESNGRVFAFETNFYTGGGSKLNETARSYKMIAEEAKNIPNFTFVWVTDGQGWLSARGNLRETFEVLDTLYNINDLENGALLKLFNNSNF